MMAESTVTSSWRDRIMMRCRAFTLIELLVVIAIIGLIIAILLPAVHAAREAARRTQCTSNLKQLAIAINNYTNDHNVFPKGVNGLTYSFHAMLLPYLEQAPLFDSINFALRAAVSKAANGGANSTAAFTALSGFLCPSGGSSFSGPTARTNYAGSGGYGFPTSGSRALFYNGRDSRYNQPISFQSMQDGTSQTVAISEWVLGPGYPSDQDPLVVTFNTPAFKQPGQFDAFVSACRSLNAAVAPVFNSKSCQWFMGGSTTLYSSSLRPNENSCLNANDADFGVFSAGSRHIGGVNTLFADGHSAFVKDSIDATIWRALSTRAGQEVIDESY